MLDRAIPGHLAPSRSHARINGFAYQHLSDRYRETGGRMTAMIRNLCLAVAAALTLAATPVAAEKITFSGTG
ncbi:MAG: hypothetical protein EOO77_09475, partial [Oxalobacteraceae bacterium]